MFCCFLVLVHRPFKKLMSVSTNTHRALTMESDEDSEGGESGSEHFRLWGDCSDDACVLDNLTPSNLIPNTFLSLRAFRRDAGEVGIDEALSKNDRKFYVALCFALVCIVAIVTVRLLLPSPSHRPRLLHHHHHRPHLLSGRHHPTRSPTGGRGGLFRPCQTIGRSSPPASRASPW